MKLKKLDKAYNKNKKKYTKFLRKFDKKYVPGLDTVVENLDKEVWQKTNCLECGNCCSKMTPTFTEEDILRISKHLEMTPTAFKKKYLEKDDSNDWVNTRQPCQFLGEDLYCSIYEIRPIDCATFPHHLNKPFDDYNHIYEQNMEYCPATFSLIKKLEKYVSKNYEW